MSSIVKLSIWTQTMFSYTQASYFIVLILIKEWQETKKRMKIISEQYVLNWIEHEPFK